MINNDPYEDLRIYSTKDYSKFVFLDKNRKVSMEHVKNLKNKIIEHGYIKQFPIKVMPAKEGFLITAGQHRFTACKEGKLKIYYTIINPDEEDLSVMAEHNGGFKDWGDGERLHRFIALKNKNYMLLYDLIRAYDFLNINTALMLLFGLDNETGQPLIKDIKKQFIDGMLKIRPVQTRKAMEHADTISQIIDRRAEDHLRHAKKSSFLRALYLLITHENFDGKKLAKAIDQSDKGLLSQSNWQETLELMVLLYNGKTRSKVIKFEKLDESLKRKRQQNRYGKV